MKIAPMTTDDFAEYEQWHYEPPYDFYDSDQDPVLNPERFFAVRDDDGPLIGFLYFEPKDDVLEYGLGLRPDLTGKGRGLDFFRAGLEFGRVRYRPSLIRLFVAAFNERAIKVYERAGFAKTGKHVRNLPGFGEVEFIDMEERC